MRLDFMVFTQFFNHNRRVELDLRITKIYAQKRFQFYLMDI